MSLHILVSVVDATNKYGLGDSHLYDSGYETLGDLYRAMKSEHGGHVAKMYRDQKEGPPIQVGWVFSKRDTFADDPKRTYLREAWVEVFEEPEKVVLRRPKFRK